MSTQRGRGGPRSLCFGGVSSSPPYEHSSAARAVEAADETTAASQRPKGSAKVHQPSILHALRHRGTTEAEVLDTFFRSVDARWRFDEGARELAAKLGLALDRLPTADALPRPPWTDPAVMRAADRAVADNIGDLVEKVRKVVEELAEPLKIESYSVDRNDPIARWDEEKKRAQRVGGGQRRVELVLSILATCCCSVKGNISNVAISKLSTFKVEELNLDIFDSVSATLNVTFETLDAHGEYNVDATASDQLHVFGDGHFE